ncbi:hypothetical protein D9M71_603630 [compost metagenome]
MGVLGETRADVQLVGELRAVVYVQRRAGDVLVGAFVLEAAANAAGDAGAKPLRQLFLGQFRIVHAEYTRVATEGCCSSMKQRRSRFCATRRR